MRINLSLLVEEDQQKETESSKEEKKTGYTFQKSPSSTRPLNIIKSSKSRAMIEPESLLKDLGIQFDDLSGNDYQKLAQAFEMSRENNEIISDAFTLVKYGNIGGSDSDYVIVRPSSDIKARHPDIYAAAIVLALQNVGVMSDSINPDPKAIGTRTDRHIIQADNGDVIVTDPNNLNNLKG